MRWLPELSRVGHADARPGRRRRAAALATALRPIATGELTDGDRRDALVQHIRTPDGLALKDALSRPAVADAVAEALLGLAPDDGAIGSALAIITRQWLRHRPVGQYTDFPLVPWAGWSAERCRR